MQKSLVNDSGVCGDMPSIVNTDEEDQYVPSFSVCISLDYIFNPIESYENLFTLPPSIFSTTIQDRGMSFGMFLAIYKTFRKMPNLPPGSRGIFAEVSSFGSMSAKSDEN